MDLLHCMKIFVRVVEAGSFSTAAQRLNLSRSVVSKQLQALESSLGVRLLQRTTRQVSPTEIGLAYHEHCLRILAEVEAAEGLVTSLQEEPRGTLKINAPMSFGTLHLGPAVAEFASHYPELTVQLTLDDRFINPLEEGFDVTIRIGELEDSSLVARRIAAVPRRLYAAPDYLRRRGEPRHPNELGGHSCLHYGYLSSGGAWKLLGPEGEYSLRLNGQLCSNNGEVLRDAAVRGLGIVLLPEFIVAGELARGRLQGILQSYSPPPIAIHALYPSRRQMLAKVRLFIDFLVARFGE